MMTSEETIAFIDVFEIDKGHIYYYIDIIHTHVSILSFLFSYYNFTIYVKELSYFYYFRYNK